MRLIEQAIAAPQRKPSVPQNVPGKTEPRSEVVPVLAVGGARNPRVAGVDQTRRRVRENDRLLPRPQGGHTIPRLRQALVVFPAQPQIQSQITFDLPVILQKQVRGPRAAFDNGRRSLLKKDRETVGKVVQGRREPLDRGNEAECRPAPVGNNKPIVEYGSRRIERRRAKAAAEFEGMPAVGPTQIVDELQVGPAAPKRNTKVPERAEAHDDDERRRCLVGKVRNDAVQPQTARRDRVCGIKSIQVDALECYSELVKQIGAERVRVAHDQVLGSILVGPFETRHGYRKRHERRLDSFPFLAKIRDRQAVRRAEMMIDLEHDLVAIAVALQVAKEGVALIGAWQQPEQCPGFGRSKRLDSLTLAVVGDRR